jgi:speckle-type POZ protein
MDEGVTAPSVVQINGIKASVFMRLLTFIYTGAMPNFKMVNFAVDEPEDVEGETAWLLELLEAAEKYGLGGLKSICEEILASRCIRETTVQDIIGVARRTRCSWLKECMEFTESET